MPQNDDDRAFLSGLYQTHFRSLWGYAYALTSDPHAADDIVQTVFAKIIKHASKLQHIACPVKLKAYLNTAIRNTSYSHIKKEKSAPPCLCLDSADKLPGYGGFEDTILETQTLADALQTLGQFQKDLITLYYHVGLSHKEIAEVMNISAPSVAVSLFRTRALIKRGFGAHE